MAAKVTFTFDQETVDRVNRMAARMHKPKSAVVREAIRDYEAQSDRLSEAERDRMLAALDEFAKLRPARPQREVVRELREIRSARRAGGRRTPQG